MSTDVKSLLSYTLLSLSSQRSLMKVTVTDILKESGIGRRTFYSYFSDKDALVEYIFSSEILETDAIRGSELLFWENPGYYTLLKKYKKFITQACKIEGQNSLTQVMLRYAEEELLKRVTVEHRSKYGYICKYHAYAGIRLSVEWINEGMLSDPIEISHQISGARKNTMSDYSV